MKRYLQKIDRATIGNRYDVTPLFADAEAFDALVTDLVQCVRGEKVHYVAGIDALGFILGTAIARALGVGFLAIRKRSKLPVDADREAFVDYSGTQKQLEMRTDVLQAQQRVLVVDEWIETGAQVTAAIKLVENQQAIVAGILTICCDQNATTNQLDETYGVHSVWAEA